MTGKRAAGKLAMTALVFLVAMTAARAQAGPWIRHQTSNHGVIVFVHGIVGDERTTWTSGNSYWPEMLTHDHTFDGQDIYVYHYPSPRLKQAFSIDEIADNMRLVLTTDGVLQHSEITFVSHSMGGIVTRAFILKYRKEIVPKIRMLYFFATPTTGSPYALIGGLMSRNPQFKELYPMVADSYLAPLQSNWLAAGMGLKSFCAYETQQIYGQIVVDRQSATNLCTERLDPIDANHFSIVKPRDQNSTQYRALKEAFIETAPKVLKELPPSVRPPTASRPKSIPAVDPRAPNSTAPIPKPPNPSPSPFDTTLAKWRIVNDPYALTLHDLFLTDFDSVQQKEMGAIFIDDAQTISVQFAIDTELALRGKFLIFYVAANEQHTAEICAYLAKHYNFVLDDPTQLLIVQKGVGDAGTISTKEAVFTNRIYVYHETYLDAETTVRLAKLYEQVGVSVIFRSIDYASNKRLEYKVRDRNKDQQK